MAESKVRTRAGAARAVVLPLSLVYLVLAVAGVATIGWAEFGWEEQVRLFGLLGVSSLLNVVHGFAGVVALVAALRGGAMAFAPVAAVAFTAMAAFGTVAGVFGGAGDPLNLTWWNVGLYLLSAAACAYAYTTLFPAREHRHDH